MSDVRARLRGSITALVTPFRDGKVDERAFLDFVDWQIKQGTHGLVPCGTTGESPTLSHDEHHRVVELAIEASAGRVPVIAGAGSNSTNEAISLAKHAKAAGADAVLVVTPYYNKPTQDGLFAHYAAIAEAVDIPIIVYNIPGRCVVDITPATMARIATLPTVIGVKEATGDVSRYAKHRELIGPDFLQFSGDDALALAAIGTGAHGCISVGSNIVPRAYADLQEAALAGDFATALQIQDRLAPLNEALFAEPNPCPVKWGAARLGLMQPDLRLPMVPVGPATADRMEAALRRSGALN
ncbi:4-hydroxy-tetrahydrodipicolinate synthase [Zavarzinia compransoris]|uniref:4-hydroxy-tetrahydrodipicolinate synthase n=1 Tax=Zavarzinia marina TaxID=2911065 RepID=UPI001F2C4356|nr:4-hydroxy-tetrahydrodipicolinate synthase [Zavarzinia marina]MCF4165482.1 4-hydroxy-tetrahydrodipicolinate synthase [Zavarzinia marina]